MNKAKVREFVESGPIEYFEDEPFFPGNHCMTDEAIMEVVSRISYKPGWAIDTFRPNEVEGLFLRVNTHTLNAYDPDGPEIELDIKSPIPPMRHQEDFLVWVMWRLRQIEIHETMEWFKVADEMFRNPHKV